MKVNKCTNCGSKNLVRIGISGPTDDGFFDLSKATTTKGNVAAFVCEDCGHIEFFVEKRENK